MHCDERFRIFELSQIAPGASMYWQRSDKLFVIRYGHVYSAERSGLYLRIIQVEEAHEVKASPFCTQDLVSSRVWCGLSRGESPALSFPSSGGTGGVFKGHRVSGGL